ncbi:MAG TPA: 2-oxo-4-hydroxy-4-carboxy-5-ureidoimidazoline decarboxylase [Spirochaetia bacterium]|nr:2-oxo-4-hydroxy-4-carboxy-5-ureidoimidazoline decarboxylase [Spirochaetia bacterium]
MKITLDDLNRRTEEGFVSVCGALFEHSPWVAARTWPRRPFRSVEALHQELISTLAGASESEKLALINAHPDLVGRLAREGGLTAESGQEQAAAGLDSVTPAEAELFEQYNSAYRRKFGFPFIICARENRKEAILKAFPARLANSRKAEVAAALEEIGRIARLRLADAVAEE